MKITALLIMLFTVSCRAELARIAPDATADTILDALHARGTGLKDFSADVKLSTTDDRSGDTEEQSGKAAYQDRGNNDARVKISFDTAKRDKTVQKKKLDFVLEGGWLTDRDYQKKLEVRRQVLKPGQKMNLLKLGEGPFPLPIGQPKEDVKKLFKVTRAQADKADPKNTVHLILEPLPKTQFDKRFKKVDVYVDQDTSFPTRVDTEEKSQSSRTTELTNVKINTGIPDTDFVLPDISKEGWNRREEPFE